MFVNRRTRVGPKKQNSALSGVLFNARKYYLFFAVFFFVAFFFFAAIVVVLTLY